MKSKEVKRKEAIARNEKHRQKYEKQAETLGLTDKEAVVFVNHKVGISQKRH